jgi:hypothetical protein
MGNKHRMPCLEVARTMKKSEVGEGDREVTASSELIRKGFPEAETCHRRPEITQA